MISAIKRKYFQFRERVKYFIDKENRVYLVMVSYGEENPIRLGVTDMREPYLKSCKKTSTIVERHYAGDICSYVTERKGEYLYAYERPFILDEKMIFLYRPSRKDKRSRDFVLFGLLWEAKLFIEGRNKLLDQESIDWQVDRDVLNQHIRQNNRVLYEIEQLISEHCFIGV